MPRARKPRQELTTSNGDGEQEQQRPSQLDQIRQAMATPPKALPLDDEAPELPAPEEAPELPAATAEEAPEPAMAIEPEPAPPPAAEPEEPAPAVAAAVAAEPVTAPWVPPPTTPPVAAHASSSAPRTGSARSSSLAVGIVLVVVGVFFLLIRLLDIDLSSYGWPLYIIIPGLTLLVVGFVSLGSGALIPGGIITVTGLVFAYQSATDDFASWAYAWALVAPGGVGLGIFLQGLRVGDSRLTRQGRNVMFWAVLIFLIGFVFFESILNISGHDYGKLGQAALPVLLIIIGVTLLVRNFQRGRSG
jgi:hypothetical protein